MTVNLTCCEKVKVGKLKLNCFCQDLDEDDAVPSHLRRTAETLFFDHDHQIMISSAQHIDFDELTTPDLAELTEWHIFGCKSTTDNEIHLLGLANPTLPWFMEPNEPSATNPPLTPFGTPELKERHVEDKEVITSLVGQPLSKIVRPSYLDTLQNIYQQTMSPSPHTGKHGQFLQMIVKLQGCTRFVKAYPIWNHKGEVTGGMCSFMPLRAQLAVNMQQLILPQPQVMQHRKKKREQQSDSFHSGTHSGIMPVTKPAS